jgi:TonB family protein
MRLAGFFLLSLLLHAAALVHPGYLRERRQVELLQVKILPMEPAQDEAGSESRSAISASPGDAKLRGTARAGKPRIDPKTSPYTTLPKAFAAETVAMMGDGNASLATPGQAPALAPPPVSSVPAIDSQPSFPIGIGASGNGSGSSHTGFAGFGTRDGVGKGSGSGTGVLMTQARPSETPRPGYPESARREGREGSVLLRVLIDDQGRSKEVEVNRSSGSDALDRAAAEAIKRWRFHPARHGGNPVESWVRIPIEFRLAGPNSDK